MTHAISLSSWASELDAISASATSEEQEALDALKGAMTPYLEDPSKLRTLLSKIKAPAVGPEVAAAMQSGKFTSVDEIKAMTNSDVTLVEA